MKHKNAEFIKAWADDAKSVQQRLLGHPNNPWHKVDNLIEFDQFSYREFRHTPKPEYRYCADVSASIRRYPNDNIRLTYIDNKLTAVELMTDGDGK